MDDSSRPDVNEAGLARPDSSRGDHAEISIVAIINVLLRRRRVAFGTPLVLVTVAAVLSILLRPNEFKATSRFTLQSSQNSAAAAARLTGLAEQFGLIVGTGQSGASPAFYAELVRSREVLREAAESRFRFAGTEPGDTIEGTIPELYDLEGATPAARVRSAIARLVDDVRVSIDVASGLLTLETAAPWPELAVALNRRLLELIEDFNLQKHQSQVRAERLFVEARLAEAQQELEEAEARLSEFLRRNRRIDGSPDLSFEMLSLQRRVEVKQQVYISLARAYEQARIAEVRESPVITVVEPPEGSAVRVGSRLVLNVAIALVFGGFIGVLIAFTQEHFDRQRRLRAPDVQEFEELTRVVVRELSPRRLARIVRSMRRREVAGHGGPT